MARSYDSPTKRCTRCKLDYPRGSFSSDKSRGDGLSYKCRACAKAEGKESYERNKAKVNARNNANYQAKRDQVLARMRDRYRQDPTPAVKKAVNRKRAVAAQPVWDEEFNDFVVSEAYRLAQKRQDMGLGVWHVDHIVPLRGKNSCGLHNGHNLQLTPAAWNIAKGNRSFDTYFPIRATEMDSHAVQTKCTGGALESSEMVLRAGTEYWAAGTFMRPHGS